MTCMAVSLFSCTAYKTIPYFTDVPDSARLSIQRAQYHPLLIQKGDVLTVNIQTIDPEANMIFGQMPSSPLSQLSGGGGSAGGQGASALVAFAPSSTGNGPISGLLVADDGTIEIPILDKIKVDSLTTEAAGDTIKNRVAQIYKSPTVTVRFANLKVNVLGEVLRPGSYVLPAEKNTIFDALALAGDLTVYGKRGNVLLIRDSAGKSNFIRFSLNNSRDLVTRDFFYLKQNDVLYVEPGKGRAAANDANQIRIFAIAASVISLIIVIATRIN